MRFIGTPKVGTNALSQLLGRQQMVGFDDSTLAVDPLWLDGIEPGAFRRQKERQNAYPFSRLSDLLVVLTNPGAYLLTHMPGGVIPDQQPGRLALDLQPRATVLQELGGDGTDRSPCDEAKRHLPANGLAERSLLPEDSITSQSFGIRISLLPALVHQAHRLLLILPRMHAWQGKAAPPHLVQKANRPGWLLTAPSNQPVPCVFFRRYNGSGLVIQCLARFQVVLSRLRARRTLSSEIGVEIIPCSKLTWAANSKVQMRRSLPKSLGRRCSRSFNRWSPSSVKLVCRRWGREEPSCSTARPEALKPWMTLRTVWSSHPSCWAMVIARSPRALASKIWQRRKTKASDERNLAWICCCSFSVTGRIKMGAFMSFSVPHFLSPLVGMH